MPSCPICGDDFAGEASCRSHARDAHTGCSYCGETFDETDELYRHWLSSHDDLPTRARKEARASVDGTAVGDTGGISRRQVLGGAVALGAGAAGLAGLASFVDDGGDPANIVDHPAGASLGTQPVLGPSPTEAPATIIAFEDPSCPRCARFNQLVLPDLKSQYIDAGELSFVYRGIPVIYPWGEEAAHVLEAVYEQEPEAFESMKTAFYETQSQFTKDTFFETYRQVVEERNIDIDVEMIISAVDSQSVQQAVQRDLDAAQSAGVRGTPTFFLFKNGTFQTRVTGAQRISVFENALDL